MIDPECRKAFEKHFCPCVRNPEPGKERIDEGNFEMSPIRVGEFILFYGRRKSCFPFHCLVGPDYILNGLYIIFILNSLTPDII